MTQKIKYEGEGEGGQRCRASAPLVKIRILSFQQCKRTEKHVQIMIHFYHDSLMKESGGEQAAADEQENNSLTSVFEL